MMGLDMWHRLPLGMVHVQSCHVMKAIVFLYFEHTTAAYWVVSCRPLHIW